MLRPYDHSFPGIDRSKPFWFYFNASIKYSDVDVSFILKEECQRVIVKYISKRWSAILKLHHEDEIVCINNVDALDWSLSKMQGYMHGQRREPLDITFRRWISVDQSHVWQTSPPEKTAGIKPSKEALEIWPRLQAEPQRKPSDEVVKAVGGGGRGGGGGNDEEEEEEESPTLASAATATTAVASFGSASASAAPAGDASSLTSATPGLKSPDPSDRYVVGTDRRVAGQPSIPRSGSTTPNIPFFNPSATTGRPTGSDGHNDYGHEDDLPMFDDDEVGTQDAGDDVTSKSESDDAKPPPRPSTATCSFEPSLGGTAAAAAKNTGILPNLPDIVAHGSAKPSSSTASTNRSSSGTFTPVVADVANDAATGKTATIETVSASDGGALTSPSTKSLTARVWEARRKQVEDAEKFLKDKGVNDPEALPDTIPRDHEPFLQRARTVEEALVQFKDNADCPLVDTYEGKIKSLSPSQLRHFLHCIERNTRFAKTEGGASHGSVDEEFLRPYLLSCSEINEREALLKLKSIDQTSGDSEYIDLRTGKCVARFVGGHSCSISAMNSAVGMSCFRKNDVGQAGQDVSVHQMTHAMQYSEGHFTRNTIRLVKIKGKNGAAKMRKILEHKGGMLLVHAVAKTPEKTKVGHYFAVNTDMKVILDCQNGKGRCISYSSVDPNDTKLVENFFRAFNVISVGKVYQVQVRVDRISQYFPHFIGAANGVFSGVQPQRLPDPLDIEASQIMRNIHTSKRKAAGEDIEGADSKAQMAPCYRQNTMSKKARVI